MREWLCWSLVMLCAAGCASGEKSGETPTSPSPQAAPHEEEPGRAEIPERVVELVVHAARGERDIALVSDDGTVHPALDVVPVAESGRPWKLVVLVQGQAWWMGNQTFVDKKDPDFKVGGYPGVREALSVLDERAASATRTLIVYGDDVVVRPGASLTEALGTQDAYADNIGRSLIQGLVKARLLLEDGEAALRALVYIGDGGGLREDSKEHVEAEVEELEAAGIDVFSIHYAAHPNDDPTGPANARRIGYTRASEVVSYEELAVRAEEITRILEDEVIVTFRIPASEKAGWTLRVGDEEQPIEGLPGWTPP